MENASKALIIAGGILIGILILSVGVYIVQTAGRLSESYDEKLMQDEINAFNDKFLRYAKEIRGQELYSLINLVKETNNKYIDNQDRRIYIFVNGVDYSNFSDENAMIQMLKNSATVDSGSGSVVYRTYNFKSTDFYDNGYIKEIRFMG